MSNQQYKDHEQYGDGQYADGFCNESDADNGEYQANLEQCAGCSCPHCQNENCYSMRSKQNKMPTQKDCNKNKFEKGFAARNHSLRADPEAYHVDESGDYNNREILAKYNNQTGDCTMCRVPHCRHQKNLTFTEQQLRKVVLEQKKNALKQSRMDQGPNSYYNITPQIHAAHPNAARVVNNNRSIRLAKGCNPKYQANGIQIPANRTIGNNMRPKFQTPINESQNTSKSFSTEKAEILKARYKEILMKAEAKKKLNEACSTRPSTASVFKKMQPKDNEDTKHPQSFMYEAFENSKQKQTEKEEENTADDQYSNSTAQNTTQDDVDSVAEGQDEDTYREDTEVEAVSPSRETSDEKIYTKKIPSKKFTLRSHRSMSSVRKIGSKRFGDVLKLQRSKSSLMSVINDGLQKCEISSKSGRDMRRSSQQSQINGSQDKSVCPCMKLVNADVISSFVKQTRDYHLQKISEEVKCIKNLEATSQKLLQPDSN